MVVAVPSKSEQHFSLSKFISRIRSKRGRNTKAPQPPPENPQDYKAPLNSYTLPLVLPEHQQAFSRLGWTTLTFPQATSTSQSGPGTHPLQKAYEDLFAASQKFFNLPDEEKQQWKHKLKSEEGWSKIPGEKEFITLRTLSYTPDILKEPARRYWNLMGQHLDGTLGRISTSLGLPDGEEEGLRRFVGPCKTLQESDEEKTATMLRLFRYEGWDEKVVAEPHADLGLLSVVVGDVPGLEVWDGTSWFPIEREYLMMEKGGRESMLVGRQLERFSNGRYPAGGHRVVSYGKPKPVGPQVASSTSGIGDDVEEKRYRFSIVFVLRAYEPVVVDSDKLETEVTGKWKEPVKDKTAGQMYAEIRAKHFNINTSIHERSEQRKQIRDSNKQKGTQERDGKEKGSG